MKNIRGLFGLIGTGCSSLCFLGLPVLMALIPVEWMGSVYFMWAVRIMVFVSLYFSVEAAYEGFKHHRNFGPLLILFPASIVLILLSFYLIPRPIGWVAFGAFVASWFWNRQLFKRTHHSPCHRGGDL